MSVEFKIDEDNNFTIFNGTRIVGDVTLNGIFTFTWTSTNLENVEVRINGQSIANGYVNLFENKNIVISIFSYNFLVDENVVFKISSWGDGPEPELPEDGPDEPESGGDTGGEGGEGGDTGGEPEEDPEGGDTGSEGGGD